MFNSYVKLPEGSFAGPGEYMFIPPAGIKIGVWYCHQID